MVNDLLPIVDDRITYDSVNVDGTAKDKDGAPAAETATDDELTAAVLRMLEDGLSTRDAVAEVVARFSRLGLKQGVCTNKFERPARIILEHLKLMPPISDVAGADTFPVRKPDPRHILLLLERMGGDPKRAVMIGDSTHDAEAARGACVIVVLHDLGLAARFANRIVVLANHQVAADGPPSVALAAGVIERLFALLVLVAASVVVYFGVAWMVGAVDRQRIATLTKKAS